MHLGSCIWGQVLYFASVAGCVAPMARPLRIEFPGALYHVSARGNARAAVFLERKIQDLTPIVQDLTPIVCDPYRV